MKYSRNPKTGILEAYTDDGVYIGKMFTMGDTLKKEESAEDGGPGSGNWGHRGRPGKRGGSGPGGGSQYRGGRSDIGYFGSRKDWLNGLSGEKQGQAARFIASQKKDYQAKLEAKNRLENLAKRGLLTVQEAEERIKEAKLDGITENMTPEEYTMKSGNSDRKKELLSHMESARQWENNANRLMKENLTEDEQKIVSALAEKYGKKSDSGADLPDVSDQAKWSQEDMDCWLDLKSKAMGGPTSGNEIPDELQYAAGLKERPRNNNPWVHHAERNVDVYSASNALTKACGTRVDPDVLWAGKKQSGETLEDLEKTAFARACTEIQADRGLKVYLKYKMDAYGGESELKKNAEKNLTPEEYQKFQQEVKIAERMGESVLDNLDYKNSDERSMMFALINKAMGCSDFTEIVEEKTKEVKEKEAKERAERERLERERQQRAAEEEKRREQAVAEAERVRKEELSQGNTRGLRSMVSNNVKSVPYGKNTKQLSSDEIVSKVGGPDKTGGSCASAALAYVANKFGHDVRDFRGGASQKVMAVGASIIDLVETPGVDGKIEKEYNDFTTAKKLLQHVEAGKEYVMTVGKHCSIVRKSEDGKGYEYLELQSSKEHNGFHPLDNDVLKYRFCCKRSHTIAYTKVAFRGTIMEVDKLANCKSFENMLPYINTNEAEQKKGDGGGVK